MMSISAKSAMTGLVKINTTQSIVSVLDVFMVRCKMTPKKEKIPSLEWLLGWFAGRYDMFSRMTGIELNKKSKINTKSREILWKLYKKITGGSND